MPVTIKKQSSVTDAKPYGVRNLGLQMITLPDTCISDIQRSSDIENRANMVGKELGLDVITENGTRRIKVFSVCKEFQIILGKKMTPGNNVLITLSYEETKYKLGIASAVQPLVIKGSHVNTYLIILIPEVDLVDFMDMDNDTNPPA